MNGRRLILSGFLAGLTSLAFVSGCSAGSGSKRIGDMTDEVNVPSSQLTAGVQRRVLPNGLTVLVKEDTSAPVVAIVTYVKSGYFHEDDDVAGISHVIEHMYFNGTPSRPDPEAISRETKGYGGVLNAGTIYDHTSFYTVLPSERWEAGLEVQADAFQNPLFDADVLAKEMEAILQEARRKLDNPAAFGREKMYELAFQDHRMRRWRIGEEEVLRGLRRDDLVRFYQDHYRPANSVLVIVGDVRPADVLGRVEELYGGQERGELRKHEGPSEPAQTEFRYQRIQGDVTRNYVFLGFHTPGVRHDDNPALQVLATVLGAGSSSRLVSKLKEELRVVTGIGTSSYQYDDVGMFDVFATCDQNDLDRAMREIFVEIERVRQFGVTEEELAKARTAIETAEALGQEEVLGQASTLAYYEALGDYRLLDEELERLRAVTAEDVQRVADEYLRLSNASVVEYVSPWVVGAREPQELAAHVEGAVLAAASRMEGVGPGSLSPSYLPREELDAWAERFASPGREGSGLHRFELPHGGVLLVRENHAVPTVAMGAYFRGGRVEESPNTAGMTRMMQRVMVKETSNRPAKDLAREIEALGTSIGRVSHDDYFGFHLTALNRNFAPAFDVLFDVLANPSFAPTELEREREAQLSAVQGIEDQSGALASQILRDSVFPDHPYGHPELGSPQLIRFVDVQRLSEHHAETVRPEAMVLTVVGDVDAETVHEFLLRYLEGWHPGGASIPPTAGEFYSKERMPNVPALLADREGRITKDRAQTALMMAFRTVPRSSPDVYPLEILQSITGGMGGTFFEEIRTRRGLAYQVSTFDQSNALGGYFGAFVACSPESSETVESLLIELISQLALDPPTEEQIVNAQNHLAGAHRVGLQTNRAQSGYVASLEILGLDLAELEEYPQWIRAVKREDLVRVAKEYFENKPHALGEVAGRDGSSATP